MVSDLAIGDRVRLVNHPAWNQPYRGWAERGRMGTVHRVWVPTGGKHLMASVLFDRSRNRRLEIFEHRDLIKAEGAPTPPSTGEDA